MQSTKRDKPQLGIAPPEFMDTDFIAPNNDYCIFKILPIKGMEPETGYVLR